MANRLDFLDVRITGLTRNDIPEVKLICPLTYNTKNMRGEWLDITVPAGFITDFASLPGFARPFIHPLGAHIWAAILHDWLLEPVLNNVLQEVRDDFDRLSIDNAFRRQLRYDGFNILERQMFYLPVASPWGSKETYNRVRGIT